MLKYKTVLAVFVLAAVLVASCLNFSLNVMAYPTHRMATIEDLNGDSTVMEVTRDDVWNRLVELYHSKEEMWIGGAVEIYIHSDPRYRWGFRFKPETVAVAEVTAEALQTTIRGISENLSYWLNIEQAFVFAKVANCLADPKLLVSVDLSSDTIARGDNVTILAFVTDDGGRPIEGATVTAVIGDLEVLFLLSDRGDGNYQGAIDTSIVHEGAYEIVVTAQKEGYELSLSSQTVTITVRSDINQDGRVNVVDISIAGGVFGSTPEDPEWNAICDLNRDEVINIQDLALVARDYGYKNSNLELETIVSNFLKTTDVPNGVWDGSITVEEIYDHKLGGKVMVAEYTTSTAGHPDFFLDTIEHHIAVITLNLSREIVSAFCVWSNIHDSEIWDLLNQKWV